MVGEGLVLAVDGGQSSTLALLCEHSGRILACGRGGAVSHIHAPGGYEQYVAAMRDSTSGALRAAGVDASAVGHICLGMTGAMDESRQIVAGLFPGAHVESHHDIITALAGASVGQPGVVVISGTGAIAYGQLADGRSAKSSGWGYLMGDEGSGYWLGVEAIRAACKASDGRGPATELVGRIPQHLRDADLMALHVRIYGQQVERKAIASLASVVGAAADAGDAVALGLLRRAGEELAGAALAVLRQLDQVAVGMNIYTTGGVFRAGAPLLDAFAAEITRESPSSTVHGAAFSPSVGALFMALQAADVPLSEAIVANIRATLPEDAVLKRIETP